MTETQTARHAAPLTALAHVKELASNLTGGNTKKGAAIAASSGLALTLAATAAGAISAPTPEVDARAQVNSTDISPEAKAALQPEVTISVSKDAKWQAGSTAKVDAEKAPEPVVQPVAPRNQVAAASRAGVRQAPAAGTTQQAAAAAQPQAQAAAAPQPAAGSAFGQQVVAIAMRYVGTPYVFGGNTPAGFDCSGFTQYVYGQLGISLPRTTEGQRGAGYVVPASQARPGDLMYWPGHVGIYLGNGQHIAARNPSTPLKVSPIYRAGATFIRLGG